MADLDADIWVCGECRSINNLRAKQCYRCRTPRDVAAVDPNQIEGTGHGKLREIALPEFQSTRWAAVLASAALIFLAVMQVVSTVADAILFSRVLRDPAVLADPAFYQSTESILAGTVALATLGVAVLALIAWSFWLSRAVMAMPALGLGYPAANGLMAFVENFLPGLNLFRVPAIVRDVMRRLDPTSLRGEVLIFVAWIGLLGGYLVPRFGTYLGLLGTGTLEEIVRETLLVQAVATAAVVVGATFLVVLIWWIERRIERQRAAQLAGESPSTRPEVEAATAAPVATYRVEEDPEFVGGPGIATRGPALDIAAGARASDDTVAGPAANRSTPTLGAPDLDGPRPGGAAGSADPGPSHSPSPAASVAPVADDGAGGSLGTIASRAASGAFTNRPITAATGAASIPPEAPAVEGPDTDEPIVEAPAAEEPIGDASTIPPSPSGSATEPSTPPSEPSEALDASPSAPTSTVDAEPAIMSEPTAAPVEPIPDVAAEGTPTTPQPPVEPADVEAGDSHERPPVEIAAGPQLHLTVESASSMIATMDGESEPITLDELRVAAEALARANGSAVIMTVGTSFGALSLAEQAFEVLEDARVVTSIEE